MISQRGGGGSQPYDNVYRLTKLFNLYGIKFNNLKQILQPYLFSLVCTGTSLMRKIILIPGKFLNKIKIFLFVGSGNLEG